VSDGGVAGQELLVPGSVSNLGPGFDTLSVAVQVYLHLRIVQLRPDVPDSIETTFEGAAPGGDNRIETAFRHARARIGIPTPGVRIRVRSDIPTRAGLGSSGAATMAGLRLYELLTTPLAVEDLLALACDVEGHPDNAAASRLGGLTVSCQCDDRRVIARSWPWPAAIQLVVGTPDAQLETAHARRVLPSEITLRDAIFNLQRAVLMVHAFGSGQYSDLREALRDRWHQPARAALVPGLSDALELEDDAILGACLSGAGPSIVLFTAGRAAEARTRLGELYQRLGMASTIRVLAAHQPAAS
jgi:homoserine kinase